MKPGGGARPAMAHIRDGPAAGRGARPTTVLPMGGLYAIDGAISQLEIMRRYEL